MREPRSETSTSLARPSPSETPLACGGANGSPKTGPRTPGRGYHQASPWAAHSLAHAWGSLPAHPPATVAFEVLEVPRQAPGPSAPRKEAVGVCWGLKPTMACSQTPFWAPQPCGPPPPQPRPSFSGSGVEPGEPTQVSLGVGVLLQTQGPTLPDAALCDEHGVFVVLQPCLGVSLRGSVPHLPRQRQLQLFPEV